MEAAFAPAEAVYKARAYAANWGHLVAKPGQYPGTVLFAVGEYSGCGSIVVESSFPGVDNSPWEFEAVNEAISRKDLKAGIYMLFGYFKRYKNGKHKVYGKVKKVKSLGM